MAKDQKDWAETIMLAPWPEAAGMADEESEKYFQILQNAVTAIRDLSFPSEYCAFPAAGSGCGGSGITVPGSLSELPGISGKTGTCRIAGGVGF